MKLPPTNRVVADKLKIVFSSDDLLGNTAESITCTLDDLVRASSATKLSTQQKGYRNRYRVRITDDDGLIVEINPNDPSRTNWAMTWEYNPAHLRRKSQRQTMRELAREILGTDSKRLLANASVSVIHLAVDFAGKLDEIAIESRDKSSCGAWGKRFHANGRLQTLYFGSSATDHQQTAYSKSDEMLAALARKPRTTLSQLTGAAKGLGNQFRLEDRQRLTRCPVPLHRLDDLREPFAGFHIYSYKEADEHITDTLGRMTLGPASPLFARLPGTEFRHHRPSVFRGFLRLWGLQRRAIEPLKIHRHLDEFCPIAPGRSPFASCSIGCTPPYSPQILIQGGSPNRLAHPDA